MYLLYNVLANLTILLNMRNIKAAARREPGSFCRGAVWGAKVKGMKVRALNPAQRRKPGSWPQNGAKAGIYNK